MKDIPKDSVTARLREKGYIVTDRKFGGWNNGQRMIVDKNGNDVGYLTPKQCKERLLNES